MKEDRAEEAQEVLAGECEEAALGDVRNFVIIVRKNRKKSIIKTWRNCASTSASGVKSFPAA
jgi:hypothetical protein